MNPPGAALAIAVVPTRGVDLGCAAAGSRLASMCARPAACAASIRAATAGRLKGNYFTMRLTHAPLLKPRLGLPGLGVKVGRTGCKSR
jgi:hypothetical protein